MRVEKELSLRKNKLYKFVYHYGIPWVETKFMESHAWSIQYVIMSQLRTNIIAKEQTSFRILLDISTCSSILPSKFSRRLVRCLFVAWNSLNPSWLVSRHKRKIILNTKQCHLKHTASADETCSNCFDMLSTALAIWRFVTNMTSEKDHPCIRIIRTVKKYKDNSIKESMIDQIYTHNLCTLHSKFHIKKNNLEPSRA